VYGIDCAPGSDEVTADMTVAPFYSASATLVATPPAATPAGVSAAPNSEVETGNTPASGDSNVAVVMTVETDPVYAEQTAEIDAAELFNRCVTGSTWVSNQGSFIGATATATLDNDGNATFVFTGSSCAAGTSTIVADILAGVHATYLNTFTIAAPNPTI